MPGASTYAVITASHSSILSLSTARTTKPSTYLIGSRILVNEFPQRNNLNVTVG
jgi:hypothetical protein